MAQINLFRTMERDADDNANEVVKAIVISYPDEAFDESIGSVLVDLLSKGHRVAVVEGLHEVRWLA